MSERWLVVAAMDVEAQAVVGALAATPWRCGPYLGTTATAGRLTLDVVVGGVGPACAAAAAATAFAVGGPYALALSAGIAGAFSDRGLEKGALVVATEMVAADLGVHLDDGFVPAPGEWLGGGVNPDDAFVRRAVEVAGAVAGPVLTLSAMTGTEVRGAELAARHPTALAEAMEGVGVAVAACRWGVPHGELRTISNLVGAFDPSAWDTQAALERLTAAIGALAAAAAAV